MRLENYLGGRWVAGSEAGAPLLDPVNGRELARAGSAGIDLTGALQYARQQAAGLHALGYRQRAALLKAVAELLATQRDKYYQLALENSGNTRTDAALDIDGGIGTLRYYAAIGEGLGDGSWLVEPGSERLARDAAFRAVHLLTPLNGVALHINAFNFPSWGLWEKAAVALLSGVPVMAKPATVTALLANVMVRDVIEAGILPPGVLSLLCGGGHTLPDLLGPYDALAFTGSVETAQLLRRNHHLLTINPRINVEADSLNVALLGPDATPGSAEFGLFVAEVVREMTQKAGQKCTAMRRLLVPAAQLDAVTEALRGSPTTTAVQMGPLVSKEQQRQAWHGIARLEGEADLVCGGRGDFPLVDADPARGCFVPPTLLRCAHPEGGMVVHQVEVFGPVATLMPYRSPSEAYALAARGGGSLVASVFSGDDAFATAAAVALAPVHGRVLLVDAAIGGSHTGHGVVMPQCVHGGPGRAGGGEELGGLRGLRFYHQRSALQGRAERLEALRGEGSALPG
ncbi:MAG TPA: 3,4-dehydroadipyl-CoA semialdehyde dehydrogenase [Gammaproteobacteria bacterium]